MKQKATVIANANRIGKGDVEADGENKVGRAIDAALYVSPILQTNRSIGHEHCGNDA